MFRVVLHWDGMEMSSSFFDYKYALREFNFLNKESEAKKANGSINEYYVELREEHKRRKEISECTM